MAKQSHSMYISITALFETIKQWIIGGMIIFVKGVQTQT